jgi:hypothetical protein
MAARGLPGATGGGCGASKGHKQLTDGADGGDAVALVVC